MVGHAKEISNRRYRCAPPRHGQGHRKGEGIQERYRQESLSGKTGGNPPGDENPLLCVEPDSKPFSPPSVYRACAHLHGHEASFDRLLSVVQPKVPKAWAPFPEPLQVDLVPGGHLFTGTGTIHSPQPCSSGPCGGP